MIVFVLNIGNDKFNEIIKTPVGKIAGILLLAFFVETAILMIYDFLSFFTLTILPKTPTIVFSTVLILLCIYAISKGFENIANISFILFVVGIIFIIFGLSGGLIKTKIENIYPVLDNGLKPVIKGAILQFSNIMHLMVLYLFPYSISTKERKLGIYCAMIAIYLVIVVLSMELIGTFGVEETNRITYKMYAIFRNINIETFFIPLWFSTYLIKVTLLYYAIIKILQKIIGVKTDYCLLVPTGVILVALTHLSFGSFVEYSNYYVKYHTYFTITVGIVVPLILLFSKQRKTKLV